MNKKGFTLIEIIIVIVILGVLATLAMPKITGQVDSAAAAEAMNILGAIKRAAVGCYDSTSNMVNCSTSASLGVSVPTQGIKFSYGSTVSANTLWLKAIKITTGTNAVTTACSATNPCIYMAVDGPQGVTSFTVDPTDSTNPYTSIITRVRGTAGLTPGTVYAATQNF